MSAKLMFGEAKGAVMKIKLILPPKAQARYERDLAELTASERELAFELMYLAAVPKAVKHTHPLPVYVEQVISLRNKKLLEILIARLQKLN